LIEPAPVGSLRASVKDLWFASQGPDLFESLSHVAFSGQLDVLTARDWQAAPPPSRKGQQKSRSRRRFSEVGDAVVQVLRDAGCELRIFEVHASVEDLLGEPVSRSSVKNYLASGATDRKTKLFERVSRGRCRFVQPWANDPKSTLDTASSDSHQPEVRGRP
jgi:hypothetical protein